MCLGVPGKIISVKGQSAVVDFWGVHRTVKLDELTEPVSSGDYIVDHGGVAVRRIPDDAVADTLGMYEVVLVETGEDPIIRDIICELETDLDVELESFELV